VVAGDDPPADRRRRGRRWPVWRIACWCAGLVAAAAALAGPIAAAGHRDFAAHMGGHLLLGMTAPLLLVLGSPVTLLLRALPVRWARTMSGILGTRPVRVVTHPVTAAALDAGGLWLLYSTSLYPAMGDHRWLHVLVQVHVLIAGYLFTAAVIGVDPAPHRPGRRTRAAVLIVFLGAHAILAKYLYGHPPAGVSVADGRVGAELMYYGGDAIDIVLIALFWWQWYAATDPWPSRVVGSRFPGAAAARTTWTTKEPRPPDTCFGTDHPGTWRTSKGRSSP
jgi:putative membrane protein